jgi:cobalt-zinc-cadmium efflux system outer membrane protein
MGRPPFYGILILTLSLGLGGRHASAQAPTYDTSLPASPGGGNSLLGPAPGSGSSALGSAPGEGTSLLTGGPQAGMVLGGRPGASVPRVPANISNPSAGVAPNPEQRPIMPAPAQAAQPLRLYGTLELADVTDLGPPNGLTMDQAIDRAIRENLDLRAKFFEIPQAEADVLNASLRANPILYADSQLIPYGQYSRSRPGGQNQYDLNITYPLDVSRKRKARTQYASRAKRVIEALYQDAVRIRIDEVYDAYVDVLAAMQAVVYMEKSVQGLSQLYGVTKSLFEKDQISRAEVNRVEIQLEQARILLIDAKEQVRNRNRTLGTFLNLTPEEAENLKVRGTLKDSAPAPPPVQELIKLALAVRPDVAAFRLGIRSAEANVRLQVANRLSDVYLLYQPYTFQNNQPFGLKSPTSWALGVTVGLPVFNRNQGGIVRAKLNVSQSQIQLATQERQTITDVQNAYKEYEVTRQMIKEIDERLIPRARQVRDDTLRLFLGGEVNVVAYLNAQRDYNDLVKQSLDTLVRLRRSMLSLNTMVGQRILP